MLFMLTALVPCFQNCFQLTCELFDSQLVEIEDATENAYLKSVVTNLGGMLSLQLFRVSSIIDPILILYT